MQAALKQCSGGYTPGSGSLQGAVSLHTADGTSAQLSLTEAPVRLWATELAALYQTGMDAAEEHERRYCCSDLKGQIPLCPGHWQHSISCYFLLLVAHSSAKVPLPKLDALRVVQGQQTSSRLARRGQMQVVLAEQAASSTVLANSSSDWQGCMLSRRAPMAAGLPREMRGQMTPFCWKPPWSACRACRGRRGTSLLWRPLWLSCGACSASWPRHMTTGQHGMRMCCFHA